jgi:riboflavin kinase / FMN adenylyltransferase
MKTDLSLKKNITSIAIGGFDGMHLAHQKLFDQLDKKDGAIVVIETGYANLSPKKYREDYTTFPIFYYPLEDIRHLHANEFINLLIEQYPKLKKIVVGYDFHFGAEAKYSVDDLKRIFVGSVVVVDEVSHKDIAVHSKIIRALIKDGDIKIANELLNKPYKIKGQAIQGQGLGKKQFVPTINLNIDGFLLPKEAIYATKTIIDNISYNSVSFIGHRVTTDGKFAVETHILEDKINFKSVLEVNFKNNINLMNVPISIEFFSRIRDNRKFKEYEELKKQILKDIKDTITYFK